MMLKHMHMLVAVISVTLFTIRLFLDLGWFCAIREKMGKSHAACHRYYFIGIRGDNDG